MTAPPSHDSAATERADARPETSSPRLANDDDAVLRAFVERSMGAALGRRETVVEMQRQRSAFSSSYASDVLVVRLRSGAVRKLFLKNFGASTFAKDETERRRERERLVYRDLLAGAGLGTARCYGSLWDASRARFWLLLEYVDGLEIRHCALVSWLRASAWLARCEARFGAQRERLSTCDFLVRHDAGFLRHTAAMALRDVAAISSTLAVRLSRIVAWLDEVVPAMTCQPPTLVHGHFRPCNIVAAVTHEGARICPVDWERAAVGSVFYDLALLSDGFDARDLNRFIRAYREEGTRHGLDPADRTTIQHLVRCFQVFHGVALLSRAIARRLPEAKVDATVSRLERLARKRGVVPA